MINANDNNIVAANDNFIVDGAVAA